MPINIKVVKILRSLNQNLKVVKSKTNRNNVVEGLMIKENAQKTSKYFFYILQTFITR